MSVEFLWRGRRVTLAEGETFQERPDRHNKKGRRRIIILSASGKVEREIPIDMPMTTYRRARGGRVRYIKVEAPPTNQLFLPLE